MLVLTRQKDENIVVDLSELTAEKLEELKQSGTAMIEFCIVDVRGDKVRLGITASLDISVHRREVYDAIQKEKAERKQAEENKD